jgi:hypothetical protein
MAMIGRMYPKKATVVITTIAAVLAALLGAQNIQASNQTVMTATPPSAEQITAQRECPEQAQSESECSMIVQLGPNKYRLTGEAYAAYQELMNREASYHALQLQSTYVPAGQQFAISIEGSADEVMTIEKDYSVTKLAEKVNPENKHTLLFGTISKDSLQQFLSQNTLNDLKSRNIVTSPLGGYVTDAGNSGPLNTFITPDQQETLAKELVQFKQARLSDIVSQASGVENLGQ